MRTFEVVGIGAGSPGHVTVEAIEALRRSSVAIVFVKGAAKQELLAVRDGIVAAHAPGLVVRGIPDPPRDRNPEDYEAEVRRWHRARAEATAEVIRAESGEDDHVAFLVWGDPSLYDSTLRIVEQVQRDCGVAGVVRVTPGVTAVQALTAAFGMVLNRIGEAIHITTGRRLPATSAEDRRNCVVMLDGGAAFLEVFSPRTYMWWGAYLGTEFQVLREGFVAEIGQEVAELKAQLRSEHGWIMDTYILRELAEGESPTPGATAP